MNRYRFEAADATGKIEVGHVEADSQAGAFGVLRSRGLTALSGTSALQSMMCRARLAMVSSAVPAPF